jgi:hypothetical protein
VHETGSPPPQVESLTQEEEMEAMSTPEMHTGSAPLFASSGLSSTSNGLLEAICVGLANLSVHINEARAARTGITSGQREVNLGARLPTGFTPVASQSPSGSEGAANSQRPDRT